MLICLIIIVLALSISACEKKEKPAVKRKPLPGYEERAIVIRKHGTLILRVPKGWKQEINKPHGDLPPTITFRPGKGDDFEIHITALWSPEGDKKFNSEAVINRAIGMDRDQMRQRAAESELVVKKFKGHKRKGYYVFATDKEPQPGKFVYIIRAGIGVGDFLLSTTVLSKTKDSEGNKKILPILADAEKEKEERD